MSTEGPPDQSAVAGQEAPAQTKPHRGARPMTAMTLLADPAIDPNKMMLEGVDTTSGPLYSVSEMAKVFFARSSHWVRWLENDGRLVLDGEPITAIRTSAGARKYDLATVEKIAHALASNGTIKTSQLRQALTIVRVQAEMHDLI